MSACVVPVLPMIDLGSLPRGTAAGVILPGSLFGDLQAMKFDEYRGHDAISLAGLIAKREISTGEVLEAAIARAEQINPIINAIVHRQY
jgi:hypothetical protein